MNKYPFAQNEKNLMDMFKHSDDLWNAVIEDMKSRQEKGLKEYGVPVIANSLSLLQWLQHAYEETLDKAVYIRAAIEKIKSAGVT
jgi:hypothetical protein